MRLIDNQQVYPKLDVETRYPNISAQLLDRTLESLSKEDGIFIFPNDLMDYPDLNKNSKVLETVNQRVKTGNVIGFLGCGQESLTIASRFSDGKDDYFLHYMLQKVLHLNLTRFDVSLSQDEQFYRLLIYLFPKYLQTALRKGFYKEYRRFSYNNSHVKGVLDVAGHLKENLPFTGEIAYTTREFSFDNVLMQLIRHTIVLIQNSASVKGILSSSSLVTENIEAIVRVTPSYKLSDRANVISLNESRPIRHAYFREYGKLQQLCLMILKRSRHGLGVRSQKIHGLLFDVAWLWEEYVHTLLPDSFVHPRNKDKKGGISVFTSRMRTVYPDFYSRELGFVLDAKYKRLDTSAKGINREDLYQLISYCYILEASVGGLVFPIQGEEVDNELGLLAGYGALLKKWSIKIPQNVDHYQEFTDKIQKSERLFQEHIEELMQNDDKQP